MKKKVAIITGGSSGIGLAVAKELLSQNYHVVNLDIQNPHENLKMETYHLDITNPSEVQKTIEKIISTHQKIGYLFSNAGTHVSGNIENTDIESIDKLININLKGTLYILKYVLPHMRQQNFGKIVLNASDQALIGKVNSTIYGCTKAATAQIAKSIAIDYSQYNININAICPGTIDTPLYRQAVKNYCQKSGENEEDVHKAEAALQLLNRLGKSEEVASLVAYLFSEGASFITGSSIAIDGGYTAK